MRIRAKFLDILNNKPDMANVMVKNPSGTSSNACRDDDDDDDDDDFDDGLYVEDDGENETIGGL
jgi:hypothetical protein